MSSVYIYGRGKGCPLLLGCLKESVNILAYIDNYTNDSINKDGIPIIRKTDISERYDYIIVTILLYENIKEELINTGVSQDRIICFYSMDDAENSVFYEIIDSYKWKTELMWKYHKEVTIPYMYNRFYEENEKSLIASSKIPKIRSFDKAIDNIVCKKNSLVRFGDGEFELMLGRFRSRFQEVDSLLKDRLLEVIQSDQPNILIAIANNYGNLDEYTEYAASGIRSYLSPKVRKEHLSLIDLNREYYDAYLSRPYIMFRDKSYDKMAKKFEYIKKIWDNQNILIIEGKNTRFGVGNDLINNVKDVIRILVPDKNAFAVYESILSKAEEYGKKRLILSIIGPTATVLSYDLAEKGYWSVDIGQVDTEYEWFLRGVPERCDIPYKTVSEYADKNRIEDIDESFRSKYEREIVAVIE